MKRFLFRYYGLIATFGGSLALLASACLGWLGKPEVVGSIIATGLAFVYFVQQQKLEETRLFHQLFCEFNRRYDKLNGRLATISKKGILDDDDQNRVVDYFNLCSEEYLYFREGYIYPNVWSTWCRGMLQYLRHGHVSIREAWEKESKSGSYYGLTVEVIEEGAATREG